MKNIVVLVSGGGTNLQALIDAEKSGEIIGGKITCVISSNSEAYALERAKNNGISTRVIPRKDYSDSKSYSMAVLNALDEEQADLVVLAGFMTILDDCGEGYYGLKVHEAALAYGVKVSGATIHFVNEEADAGAIILQGVVNVEKDDTPEILQKRIMENVEWKLLPKAASLFCQDKIEIIEGKAYVKE